MTKNSATKPTDDSFFVIQFDPPSSSVAAIPTTINITFSQTDLNVPSLNALTHFNMICNGFAFAAASVVYSSGSIITAVTMPAITGFPSGTVCQFIVSANLQNSEGVHLSGLRMAEYRLL
ncbi:MAG: hypothetical protein AB7K68_13120 [Bacteriovoracia bacterium]